MDTQLIGVESVRLEWKSTVPTFYFECKLFISVYIAIIIKKGEMRC